MPPTLGFRLLQLRGKRSLRDMAAFLVERGMDVTHASWHNWEVGRSKPSPDNLKAIATALHLDEKRASELFHLAGYQVVVIYVADRAAIAGDASADPTAAEELDHLSAAS